MTFRLLKASEKDISARKLFWGNIFKRWHVYLLGVLSVLCTNIGEVAVPKSIQWAIDFFGSNNITLPYFGNTTDFSDIVLIFIFALTLMTVSRFFWRLTLGQETHFMAATLKMFLWDRVRFFPTEFVHQKLTPGHLMNVSTSDIGRARTIFGWLLVGGSDLVFLGTLCLVSMFAIHPTLTLISLIPMPLLPFILHYLAKREELQHRISQESLGRLNDMATQSVETVRLQKLNQVGRFWQNKLNIGAKDYQVKRLRVDYTASWFGLLMGVVPIISFALMFYFGIEYVNLGELSIGQFVAMQSYIFLLQHPLAELGYIIAEWQESYTSLDRYAESISHPQSHSLIKNGKDIVLKGDDCIKIENLSFNHHGSHDTLIDSMNLEIRAGRRLGIYGPIGSGKSTLLNIMAGLERDFSGRVSLFGNDVRDYDHKKLRDTLILVSQKSFLFSTSIFENIRIADLDMSEESAWHYLKIAGLDKDVKKFKDGIHTTLGEWGINISGGQKQRLSLARALARKPQVLLLDDCLSAVDTLTEELILKNLDRDLKNTTLVWVAHRKSTLKYCNNVIQLGRPL